MVSGNDQIPSAKAHGAKQGLSILTLTYYIFSTQKNPDPSMDNYLTTGTWQCSLRNGNLIQI